MTDSNRPRHSFDDYSDDDRPLDLGSEPASRGESQGGRHHLGDEPEPDAPRGAYGEPGSEFDDSPEDAERRHHEAGRRRIGGAAAGAVAGAGAAGAGAAGARAGAAGNQASPGGRGADAPAEADGAAGEPAGAAAGGAGAAAGEPGGAVGAEARSGQGLPLRGLAMVLIAVAIGLIGWGAISFVNGRGDDDAGESGVHAEQQEAGDPSDMSPAEQARLAKEKEAAERAKKGEEADKEAAKAAEEKAKAEQQKKADAEKAGANAAPGEVDRGATHVTVLNNSPIEGLAGRTAGELRDEKWDAKSVGNLPDSAYVFQESVVLYPKDDAQAKAAAEQIAQEYNIEARERNAEIDKSLAGAKMLEGPGAGAVVVVTVNDMPR